jgi:hypothetical protein
MNTVRQILKNNLDGSDLAEISLKMDLSISKIRNYIDGKGAYESEEDRILDFSFKYFCQKYKELLEMINEAKSGKKVSVEIISAED